MTYPDVVAYSVPFFVLAIGLELFLAVRRGRTDLYETRDALTSLTLGTLYNLEHLLYVAVSAPIFAWLWEHRWFDAGQGAFAIGACFVLDDLAFYALHRAGHRVRWFWANHVVHHSSQHYNLTTALRQSWTGTLAGLWIFRAPLVLLGFHPALVAFCAAVNLVYQFWIHTELIDRMPGWFEAVFNTPSHHRVHHGRRPQDLDTNYGGVLIVWDRLFGTFTPEPPGDRVDYGLVKPIGTFHPVRAAFHGWIELLAELRRPDLTPRQKLGVVLGPPEAASSVEQRR